MSTTDDLIADLHRERNAFLEVLSRVEPGSFTTPGLVGEWSARELIAHLGYWAGHATELVHRMELGEVREEDLCGPAVDEINATVARIASDTPLATVQKREAASVEALVERLRTLDPALLSAKLPDGATLAEGIREDGPGHYREHAEALRAVLEAPARG